MKHPRRRRNRSLPVLVSFFTCLSDIWFIWALSMIETRKTYRAVLSEPKLVVPYDHSPPQVTLGATDQLAESITHLVNAVPQKRIRDNTVPEPNGSPTQGFGLSQQKKRKKNQKGEKTIM